MTDSFRMAARWFAIATLSLLLAACNTLAGLDMSVEGRHMMWVEHMQSQVGKGNMHNCQYWICLHRNGKLFLGDIELPSGNLEAGYVWGYTQPKCRYYFEYDPKTGSILGFRFEESERFACRISGA